MPVPDKFHICIQNDFQDFTVVTSPAADSEYPETLMQNEEANDWTVFPMAGETGVSITGTDAAQRSAGCFGIHNHTMLSDCGARLRLFALANWAGKLMQDTGSCSVYLDGATQYLSSPDVAVGPGDLLVYHCLDPDNPTPATDDALHNQWDTAGERAWANWLLSTGLIRLELSSDGINVDGQADSPIAPSFGNFKTAIRTHWNCVTGLVTFSEYNQNSESYDALVDPADFDYLETNDLWEVIGTDDSGFVGAIHNSSAGIFTGRLSSGGSMYAGTVVRAAAYVDGVIISDHDARRMIIDDPMPTTMSSEPGQVVTVTGDPDFTVTYPPIAHTVPWTSAIVGVNPLGGFFESFSKLKTSFSSWFENVVYRSFRIDLNCPSTLNNQLLIDQICLGPHFSPEVNFKWNLRRLVEDRSKHTSKPGGGLNTIPYEKVRTLRIEFDDVSNTQSLVFENIMDKYGKEGVMLMTIDPNDSSRQKYRGSSFFKRKSDYGPAEAFREWNESVIEVEEN